MQLANKRLGTHDTKTRAEVRGGGRKPWRQKGTGRARQGSIRAPHWAGGGVIFGPHPRSYTQRMPRRMRRLAVRSALSAKLRDERVLVVDGLLEMEPRTKEMKERARSDAGVTVVSPGHRRRFGHRDPGGEQPAKREDAPCRLPECA